MIENSPVNAADETPEASLPAIVLERHVGFGMNSHFAPKVRAASIAYLGFWAELFKRRVYARWM